ncbi:transcription factor IIIB 60 kDa subunit-like isoform X2 [Mercurialis annua]|uniref:transcription factor IIIB 60 kDa subunit-like isoform X2 n=1 Tax=Mercurialis annua TaxID=3986 RepID=UPI0024AE8D19|nr:transcription factor IIIB 60 kDa subunit-like isoform X2 [Mercurialis annua]
MVFCKSCHEDAPGFRDTTGILSCGRCGRVFKFDNYSEEPTFGKDKFGQISVGTQRVPSIETENFSRQRLYDRAYDDMKDIKNGLEMGENVAIVDEAMVYYRIAVERNFTKGRRTEQVQAACLYIACRENRKPYLLIDFSNFLRINIYVLGAVFLQLCKVLNLTEHPICQKLLDPSIFIHKYTASLSGGKNKDISDAALTIIASMNRDWIQTGRRPSGLWGAALYIAALSHGLTCTKLDILERVHVCEATLSKRLIEFENTESGSLTMEEIIAKAEELRENSTDLSSSMLKPSNSKGLLCQHKGTKRAPLACGLCHECYEYFIGFDGGSDPPAFQLAERKRKDNLSAINNDHVSNSLDKELHSQHIDIDERLPLKEPAGVAAQRFPTDDVDYGRLHEDMSSKALDESGNFSDIDDAEVDGYLHNEEEVQFKRIIWEEMNREYLEEQAAKEAVAAAAKEAWEAKFKDCPEKMQAARELEAAVADAVAKTKKERQQKRAAEAKNSVPPESASEAARQMLTKKRLSSKINYDALEKLFDERGPEDAKKQRTESHTDADADDKLLETEDKYYDLGRDDHNENEDAETYNNNNNFDYSYDFQDADDYSFDDT